MKIKYLLEHFEHHKDYTDIESEIFVRVDGKIHKLDNHCPFSISITSDGSDGFIMKDFTINVGEKTDG